MKRFSKEGGRVIRLNRRDLPSDRENRPGLNREIRAQRFGVYRPLVSSSQRKLAAAATRGVADVITTIEFQRGGEDRMAEIVVQEPMATTLVHAGDIGRKRLEMLRTGFRLRHEIDALHQALISPYDVSLTVGIDLNRVEWIGNQDRKLAVFFDGSSEGYDRLLTERDVLARTLGAHSLRLAEVVRTPNHVTLLHYGNANDQLDLNRSHKKEIVESVQDALEDGRTYSVDLLGLNFGPTYDIPHELWSRAEERAAAIFPHQKDTSESA